MIAYEAADVTVAPEPDDPAAIAVLESFAVGTPVLAMQGTPPRQTIAAEQMLACITPRATSSSRLCDC